VKRRPALWKRLVIYALVILTFYLGLCTWLAWKYVRPTRLPVVAVGGATPFGIDQKNPAQTLETAIQKGQIPAYRFEPEQHPLGAVVLMHGYGGGPEDWTDVGAELQRRGYLVVIPVAPAHANSTESQTGFGTTEADTVIAAAEWIKARHPELPILAHGISLGGASCWMASARRPDLFRAIGSDGGFADLNEASRAFLGPGRTILAPVIPIASLFAGVDPAKIRPEEAAGAWRGQPAVVMHGDADRLFSIQFSERIAEAAGVKVTIAKGGRHANSIEVLGLKGYVDALVGVLPKK
jgi:dienelactone hydrolase